MCVKENSSSNSNVAENMYNIINYKIIMKVVVIVLMIMSIINIISSNV